MENVPGKIKLSNFRQVTSMDETCFGLTDAMSADTAAAWENRALELCEEYLGPEKFVRRLAKHERVSWPLSRSSICRGVTQKLMSIDVN